MPNSQDSGLYKKWYRSISFERYWMANRRVRNSHNLIEISRIGIFISMEENLYSFGVVHSFCSISIRNKYENGFPRIDWVISDINYVANMWIGMIQYFMSKFILFMTNMIYSSHDQHGSFRLFVNVGSYMNLHSLFLPVSIISSAERLVMPWIPDPMVLHQKHPSFLKLHKNVFHVYTCFLPQEFTTYLT